MRIAEITTTAYRLPPASPWEDATNTVAALEFVVVHVRCDDGTVGVGFTYTVDIGGSAIAALIRDYLAPLAIGHDPLRHQALWTLLDRQSRRLGLGVNKLAIAAIDIAVWDIIGKHHATPLHVLLGGAREEIPAYVSEINLSASDTPDALAGRLEGYLSQGYRAVKIKIGLDDVDAELHRLEVVRAVLPRGTALMVDLNQKLSRAEARSRLAGLERFDLRWVEEPLNAHDVAAHAELRRSTTTPIALGESLHSAHQFLAYLQAGAVDVVQADVAFVGGITPWVAIANLAATFGAPIAPHYLLEISLPLLCGVPNGHLAENVVGGSFVELGFTTSEVEIVGGVARPSSVPGHGITIAPPPGTELDPASVRATFGGGSK